MIHPAIQIDPEVLRGICERFEVRRLELFGSATSSRFDVARSDVDFVVSFQDRSTIGPADRYFGLLWALEDLLGRKVDLIEAGSVRNPYFRRSLDASREVVFAA